MGHHDYPSSSDRMDCAQCDIRGGDVWLVGAGPGDPRLITRLGWDAIRCADVVVHDALLDPRMIEELPKNVQRVYVGKRGGVKESPQQSQVSQTLIDLARDGLAVVRLKGGDPLIFGRGGEEITALRRAGIPFRVIPGITAANGAMSWLGIPLTERTINASVAFISATECAGKAALAPAAAIDWPALGCGPPVLVFYMARANLPEICRRLLEHGRQPDDDALILASVTTNDEQAYRCTLGTADQIALDSHLAVLFVVGEVCRYYHPTQHNSASHQGPSSKG